MPLYATRLEKSFLSCGGSCLVIVRLLTSVPKPKLTDENMKTPALFLALVLGLTFLASAAEHSSKSKLRHVVAFKFKEGASGEKIKEVEDAFRNLKKKIKEIQDYEWGTNVSKESRNKGCTHGFILTFRSEKDRDAYIDHPAHKEFGKLVGPVLDDVFVIDFWAQE